MSKLRAILLIALAQTAISQQQSARPSIQGMVVSVSSGRPIGDALVELTVVEGGKVVSRTATTRDDGKFSFSNLSAGSGYQIVVTGSGLQPTAYGQRTSEDPWIPIALADGEQRTDLRVTVQSLSSATVSVS